MSRASASAARRSAAARRRNAAGAMSRRSHPGMAPPRLWQDLDRTPGGGPAARYRRCAMTYEADPRVDAYIAALPEWQQSICQEVRELVHVVLGGQERTDVAVKRSVQPYFVLDGNICALLAAKDHVNVFLYDG